jgi:hypothetical protein
MSLIQVSCKRYFTLRYFTLLLFLLFSLLYPLPGLAKNTPCDSNLKQQASDSLSYRPRQDRCEGRYIQEVASTILVTASLTAVFEDYDLKSGRDLTVAWQVPQKQDVYLRAQGVRYRLFYRMDAVRSAGSASFQWPTDILAALEIPRRDLGVLGWMSYALGGVKREVYLPLRISQQGHAPQARTYHVVLWPGQELTEVFVSLAPMKADGSIGPFLPNQDGRPLKYGYYPAERAIEFDLPAPETPGIYYLEIGATPRKGGIITIPNWFYHAG